MLELEQALDNILALVPPSHPEWVPLDQAHRRVLAQEVIAQVDLPSFDNSAMDGFAVRAADVSSATTNAPITLRIAGRIAAGDTPAGPLAPGSCLRIFTGSPMPAGADAVVMQEDTSTVPGQADQVRIHDKVGPGENVRHCGNDIIRGTRIGSAGDRLRSNQIALLAAQGVSKVPVGQRPTVGLISTGSELRQLGHPLDSGQIYESNRYALAALIAAAGGIPKIYPIVRDTLEDTRTALATAFKECDIVVTSGGVSVGEMDFVKPAVETIGGTLQFWRVAIKPGKPFVLGRMGDKLLCGLPGNPVSAFVTFLLLVRPVLLKRQGAGSLELPHFSAPLGEKLSNHGDRRQFVRVKLDSEGRIFSAGPQGSHCLHSLAEADGLLDLSPGATMEPGQIAQVLYWE